MRLNDERQRQNERVEEKDILSKKAENDLKVYEGITKRLHRAVNKKRKGHMCEPEAVWCVSCQPTM